MLEIVEARLPPVSCFLYKKSFVNIDCFLVSQIVSSNVSCVFGHTWPIVALPLYAPVKAYVAISGSRAMNSLKLYLGFFSRYGSSQDTSTASIIQLPLNNCEVLKFFVFVEEKGWRRFWITGFRQSLSSMAWSGMKSVTVAWSAFLITFISAMSSLTSALDANVTKASACLLYYRGMCSNWVLKKSQLLYSCAIGGGQPPSKKIPYWLVEWRAWCSHRLEVFEFHL